MAYEGQDLIDYEAGDEYLPQRYYQQKFQRNITGPEIMGQGSGITSASAARPYVLPGPSTPGGDKGGGFGWFGNLDKDNKKVFDKQVWGVSKPGGQLGWVNQPVTGYMNVNTGQYQTEEGKNINHLGLEVPSVIGMIGNKLTGQEWGVPQVGDTKGTFTKDAELSDEEAADKKMYDDLHKKMLIDNRRKQLARINALEGNKIFVGGGGMDIKDGRDAPLPPPPDYKQDQGGGLTLGEGFTESDTGGRGHHGGGMDMASAPTQSPSDAEGTPFAQGGRIGYNRGRVVNPGGYAGDEDAGILEWIKSKMGSESETNPTVFGTQDSLLNRGSIGQLENAIKSYEALMLMGELDEEQQADYELKLSQLSALTEGATQKAHGGRVPFFYGGLATIL